MSFAHVFKDDPVLVLKANPYHGPDGRFSSADGAHFVSTGPAFAKTLTKIRSGVASPTAALDFLERNGVLETDEYGTYRYAEGMYSDNNEPRALRAVCDAKGYTSKPKVVARDVMDKLVAAGGKELFRGDAKPEYTEGYRSGDMRYGLGIYGNGIYMAGYAKPKPTGSEEAGTTTTSDDLGRDAAIKAAKDYAGLYNSSSVTSDQILRAVLPKTAKVANFEDLLIERGAERDRIAEPHTNMTDHFLKEVRANGLELSDPRVEAYYAKYKKKADKARRDVERFDLVHKDLGVYAASKGYDAIHDRGTEYMVILNRSVLIVEGVPS